MLYIYLVYNYVTHLSSYIIMLHIYLVHNYTVVGIATVVCRTVRGSNKDVAKFFCANPYSPEVHSTFSKLGTG